MEKITTPTNRPLRDVGGPVSNDYFQALTEGFKTMHPTEQSTVFIPKELIRQTLQQFPGISGIRFQYGIKEGADPSSRTIILIPGLDETADRLVPNFLFLRHGYLTSEGDHVSPGQCWNLFTRYVDRMAELLPDAQRKDIPRAAFFGINALEKMTSDEKCAGILYHFGYNPDKDVLPLRYQCALKAVDHHFMAFDPPVDTSNPCPPAVCGDGSFFFFHKLAPYISDASLIEMHHYASPALIETFQQKQMRPDEWQTLFETQFAECLELAEAGRSKEANTLFKHKWESWQDQYLYIN